MNRLQRRAMAMAAMAVLVVLAAGGGSSGAASKQSAEDIRGQTINVLVPYRIPKEVISSFTKATGVKVNYVVTGWDATHSKLVVANTARTYIADVAEFDWSFTGQFAGAKWVEPLDDLLPKPLLADLASTDAAFKAGGKTYAACFSNDFRISIFNKKLFAKAGITKFPTTLTGLGQAADKLKAAGVKYPLSIPMAATEGGVTPWYLLTLANGGQLFDKNFKPTFDKPGTAGYKALQWLATAVKKGWVSPGAVSLDDAAAFDKFTAGQTAAVLATGPGNLVTANDPKESSIAGDAVGALVPGVDRAGGVVRPARGPLHPGHGQAQGGRGRLHRVVAEARQRDRDLQAGGQPALRRLGHQAARGIGRAGRAASCSAAELKLVKPLFPQGAPVWYSQFSSDAQGLLNAAVKGQKSVGGCALAARVEGHRARQRLSAGSNVRQWLRAHETAAVGLLMVVPAMAAVGGLIVYPLVRGFQTSIQSSSQYGQTPRYVGLRNYRQVLDDQTMVGAMRHTFEYVLLAVSLELVLGILVAVTLRRLFPGRGIVLAILILPWALPSVVSGVLWRRVFDPDNGLLNSLLLHLHVINDPHVWLSGGRWAIAFVTIVHVWGVLPLVSLIFLAGLQSIPEELYNASSVDGAGALAPVPLHHAAAAAAVDGRRADDRHAARDRDLRRGLRAQRHGAEHPLDPDPGLHDDVRRGRLRARHGARLPARGRDGRLRDALRARPAEVDAMKEALGARALKLVAIVWIVAWSLGPIVIGVVTSISSQRDVRAVPARWVPHEFTLDSYRALLQGTSSTALGRHRDRGRRLQPRHLGERAGGADGDRGDAGRRHDGGLRVRPPALPARADALLRRARDDARAGLRGRGDALQGHGGPAPDRHEARAHARLRRDPRAARDVAPVQPRARDGHRPGRGGARRRLQALAGVRARGRAADGRGDRRRRRDRRALGVGRVPDPAAADLDRQLQAGDGADHRVRRQVHDELPDRGGRRRARAAAARRCSR